MQAARLMTLHAAWTMDQVGASNARVEIAMIKYWGARVLHDVIDRAIQVHGSLGFSGRPAAGADVPRPPGPPASTTAPTRCTRHGGPPDPAGYSPAEVPTEHVPTRAGAARERFAEYLDNVAVSA